MEVPRVREARDEEGILQRGVLLEQVQRLGAQMRADRARKADGGAGERALGAQRDSSQHEHLQCVRAEALQRVQQRARGVWPTMVSGASVPPPVGGAARPLQDFEVLDVVHEVPVESAVRVCGRSRPESTGGTAQLGHRDGGASQ